MMVGKQAAQSVGLMVVEMAATLAVLMVELKVERKELKLVQLRVYMMD